MTEDNSSKDQLAGKAVGEMATGKTSIILRLTEDSFSPEHISTLVSSINDYRGEFKTVPFRLLVWDTSGQEKFRSLNQIFSATPSLSSSTTSPTEKPSKSSKRTG